ncbi:MAG: tetratricopeptide repeat protein [Thermoanaerobaculia bacterium]|nr:tetratricopeptide repeat protein [Thermoanaerobaculia bacterium]
MKSAPLFRTLPLLLAFVATIVLAASASAQLSVVFIDVVDSDGEPVKDAEVRLVNEDQLSFDEAKTTNKKGKVRFSLVVATVPYQVVIEKAGYQAVKSMVRPNVGASTKKEYVLRKYAEAQQQAQEAARAGAEVTRSYTRAQNAFNRGVEAYKGQDFTTASAEFQQALSLDPELHTAHSALATLYLEAGNAQAALQSAQLFTVAEPENPRGWRLVFEAQRALGNNEEADKALDRLGKLESGTDDAAFLYNEGVESLKVGDLVRGTERMESALRIDPDLQAARKALAIAYINLREWQKALDNAEAFLAQDPSDVTVMKIRLDGYRGLGDEAKAMEALKAVAAADPTVLIKGYMETAKNKFDQGDAAGALADLQQIQAIQPDHGDSLYLIGLCFINLEQVDKAKETFARLLEVDPNNANAATAKDMMQYL